MDVDFIHTFIYIWKNQQKFLEGLDSLCSPLLAVWIQIPKKYSVM